jgi:hypothetical protein
MNVGALMVKLRLPENQSLKGKRQVIKSITSRVRSKFNVSIAEVDDQELWQLATLGVACVSNSNQRAQDTLTQVVNFIAWSRFEAEILDYKIEIIPV